MTCPTCRQRATLACITPVYFPIIPLNNENSMNSTNAHMRLAIRESLKDAKREEIAELKLKLGTLQSHYQELMEVFDDFQEGLKVNVTRFIFIISIKRIN
jgi:hypothetical protein